MTILVAGATGNVGRQVVTQLLAAGQRVRALTRNPATAALPDGAQVHRGDLLRPATLTGAFDGVDRMHLLTTHDCAERQTAAEIAGLAARAGVTRATVMSGGNEHHVVDAVTAAGIACTHLDPGEFMTNTLDWAESIRTEGVVRAPFAQWTSAMIHEADIAAAAVTALLTDGHAGQHYILTGAEELTRPEVVRTIGDAIGRELTYVEQTVEQASQQLRDAGVDEESIGWLMSLGADSPNDISPASNSIQEITGRPARTFAQWCAEHADDFR